MKFIYKIKCVLVDFVDFNKFSMKNCSRRERRAIAHDAGLGSPRGALHGGQAFIKCISIIIFNFNQL